MIKVHKSLNLKRTPFDTGGERGMVKMMEFNE